MPMGQPGAFGAQPMFQGQPRPQQPGQAAQDPFVSQNIIEEGFPKLIYLPLKYASVFREVTQ